MTAPPAPVVPVEVALDGPLGRQVAVYVEAELGWQVVASGGPPRPAVRLVALDGRVDGAVVVVEGTAGETTTRAAAAAGALDVIEWPSGRARLRALPVGQDRHLPTGPPVVRVAGVGGGVGTSTVTLAVAGLLAWASATVIVVGGDGLCRLCGLAPWVGPGAIEVAALHPADAAAEVEVLACPVRGVAGLRALGGGSIADAAGWAADVVVVDAGRVTPAGNVGAGPLADSADLLVAAPNDRLAAAAGIDAPLLLSGSCPLDDRGAARLLGRAPAGRLSSSARVARAGRQQRIPAGLPGTWLRTLSTALGTLDRSVP